MYRTDTRTARDTLPPVAFLNVILIVIIRMVFNADACGGRG